MKYILTVFILSIFGFFNTPNANSQATKIETVEFGVEGVCNMCKTRIENAAYIKGVKQAEWNKETSMIKVTFNTEKTDLDKIHKSISESGHSTDKIKTDEISYNKLPKCCAYNSGVQKH